MGDAVATPAQVAASGQSEEGSLYVFN